MALVRDAYPGAENPFNVSLNVILIVAFDKACVWHTNVRIRAKKGNISQSTGFFQSRSNFVKY